MAMGVAEPEKVLIGYDPTVISLRGQAGPIEVHSSRLALTHSLGPVQGGDGFYEDFNAGLREFLSEMKTTGGTGGMGAGGGAGPALLAGIDFDESPALANIMGAAAPDRLEDFASFVVSRRSEASPRASQEAANHPLSADGAGEERALALHQSHIASRDLVNAGVNEVTSSINAYGVPPPEQLPGALTSEFVMVARPDTQPFDLENLADAIAVKATTTTPS